MAVAAAIAGVVVGCGAAPVVAPEGPSRVSLGAARGGRGAHVQVVRAMATGERAALVERFRERNGREWMITLGAGGAPDDVDGIRGIVRRAKREAGAAAGAGAGAGVEGATGEAIAFAERNAELLGFGRGDVAALDVEAGAAKTTVYGTWVVHLRGKMPMRGYEGFEAVASTIDVLLYVGDDGAVRYFVNLSKVHPRLVLDTVAVLGPDDKRLLRYVLGREMFVVVDDPTRPGARVREQRRISVGRIEDADVRAVRSTIHVSPGPRGAYTSYTLAYAVDVRRQGQDFRFIADADTGDLLDDAAVPVVQQRPDDDD